MEDVAITRRDDLVLVEVTDENPNDERGFVRTRAPREGIDTTIAPLPFGIDPGLLVFVARDDVDALTSALPGGERTLAEWDAARVRAGVPRLGRELLVGETIPLEAGLWSGVSFNKGCYLGQEVIERLFSRGSPNKRLRVLRWDGAPVGHHEPLLTDEGREAGFVTSAVEDGNGRTVAMGFVRRRYLDGETALRVGELTVTLGDHVGGESPES